MRPIASWNSEISHRSGKLQRSDKQTLKTSIGTLMRKCSTWNTSPEAGSTTDAQRFSSGNNVPRGTFLLPKLALAGPLCAQLSTGANSVFSSRPAQYSTWNTLPLRILGRPGQDGHKPDMFHVEHSHSSPAVFHMEHCALLSVPRGTSVESRPASLL